MIAVETIIQQPHPTRFYEPKLTTYVLRSRGDVEEFLSTRPDADQQIIWTCPSCHARNHTTYHSRSVRCASCDRGRFPAICLPIHGDEKSTVRNAFYRDTILQIRKDVEEARKKIASREEEIEDLQKYIREREMERIRYENALHEIKPEAWKG